MSMNNMKSFINMETLNVEIHSSETDFEFFGGEDEEEDEVQNALDNPDKFLQIDALTSTESFQVMEGFAESVKDKHIRAKLI